ncbi:MAG TPA: hypothetical protein PLQ34_07860 [Ferrovaceae bacterium]|nr:hypothetical protein [Ferrovaceae bacterium]
MKTVFDVILEQLEDQSQGYNTRLLSGAFKNFDEYRYEAGVYRGLTLAINIVKDLAKNIEEQLDE